MICKYVLRFVLLLLCLYCFAAAKAQKDTTIYDTRTGLSHWIVSDVLQDRNGFIWLATWNGLNRYDGYSFRHIKTRPGGYIRILKMGFRVGDNAPMAYVELVDRAETPEVSSTEA